MDMMIDAMAILVVLSAYSMALVIAGFCIGFAIYLGARLFGIKVKFVFRHGYRHVSGMGWKA